MNHTRDKRLKYANLILDTPELLPDLLDILFDVDDKTSCRAAWVLEFVCADNLELLLPYLDVFTENINKVHLDPAVRPIAKICEYLAKAYFSKTANKVQLILTNKHKELIVETCFDYMINDEKIAPKAYSMNTLFLFGNEFDWIHPELIIIIERDYQIQSSGFKARARQILKKIKK
ncbi:adenylosuccinate lyase [Xanthomarina sp. F2636L]|uniref:adenylosuccinate lyase n=1 Tax=Xanthomarina sp. F2636L TaxID=2996018 RepID=UPI002B20650D|nr:adenylosuccinate lyase [Xanthomarina sp. F2636L]